MKRLKKAYFMNLERQLGIDDDKAIELIQKEDKRLNFDNMISYGDDSAYGGIYKDENPTTDNITLFAVEFYAFELYDIKTDKFMSYGAAVASNIDYKEKGTIFNPQKGFGQYAEVYPSLGDNNYTKIIAGMMKHVTINGLSLQYVSQTFKEAVQILKLA